MEFKYDTCNFTDFERVSEINTTDNFTTKKKKFGNQAEIHLPYTQWKSERDKMLH